jgi:hypothetical protein
MNGDKAFSSKISTNSMSIWRIQDSKAPLIHPVKNIVRGDGNELSRCEYLRFF